MALHIDYCATFGLTRDAMESTPENQGLTFLLTPKK
jgi:hypothetical protein